MYNGQPGKFFNHGGTYVGGAQVTQTNSDGTVDVCEQHVVGRGTGSPSVSSSAHPDVEYVPVGGTPTGASAYFQAI